MSDLLVVVDDIAQMVATGVVRLAHAHGVVGQVDIAVVAEEFRHGCGRGRACQGSIGVSAICDCITALGLGCKDAQR